MGSVNYRSLLVCDPDQKFLQDLESHPLAAKLPPVLANAVDKAREILKFQTMPLSGVFINPRISEAEAIQLVSLARQNRPNIPIYFLKEKGDSCFDQADLSGLTVCKVLEKPVSYGVLLDCVQLSQTKPKFSLEENEILVHDEAFSRTLAVDFLAGNDSSFDIYTRLASGKYRKILAAGDSFSRERLDEFLRKEVTWFYVRREEQERYMRFCEQLAVQVLKDETAPQSARVSVTLKHGQEVLSFMLTHGVSEKAVRYAGLFVDNVQALTKNLRLERDDEMKRFFGDLGNYEHSVSTAVIASLLTVPLHFESEKAVKQVGMSCFLHDVGLLKLGAKFYDCDPETLSTEEMAVFQTHPRLGAEMLRGLQHSRELDSVVIQAVEQHHERRTRTGFPDRLGPGNINRIAEVVGISDEFLSLIHKAKYNPNLNPLRAMEASFHGFSAPVVDAFRLFFCK